MKIEEIEPFGVRRVFRVFTEPQDGMREIIAALPAPGSEYVDKAGLANPLLRVESVKVAPEGLSAVFNVVVTYEFAGKAKKG